MKRLRPNEGVDSAAFAVHKHLAFLEHPNGVRVVQEDKLPTYYYEVQRIHKEDNSDH